LIPRKSAYSVIGPAGGTHPAGGSSSGLPDLRKLFKTNHSKQFFILFIMYYEIKYFF
tara:strand:+ start:47 stop:217 length:171 start_codon:yes stop_codon:yes gene_type:complete